MSAQGDFNAVEAQREKTSVALTSLAAACALTVLKIVIGVWTNSLGIVSEAAHSGLDLATAAVTLWTVRASGRPADDEHHYGHGKFENVSALVQTALLWMVCGWIIFEGVQRLAGIEEAHVNANVWAFAVIILSIVVDIGRSRALSRAAAKYQSQALEADALHFSTDVWSSLVVLVGLICAALGDRLGIAGLHRADAAAALAVAGIVLVVSFRLAQRAVAELVDTVPAELRERIERAVGKVTGVLRVSRVRLRRSGAAHFVDVTIDADRTARFEQAHELTESVEAAVTEILPGADVVVHVEPTASTGESLSDTIALLAARMGLNAHSIHVYQQRSFRVVELHIEVPGSLMLKEAHEMAHRLESAVREAATDVRRIVTHIEPAPEPAGPAALRANEPAVREAIDDFLNTTGRSGAAHCINVNSVGGRLNVSLHLALDANLTITEAHELSERLERHIRQRVPTTDRVVIHVEPSR